MVPLFSYKFQKDVDISNQIYNEKQKIIRPFGMPDKEEETDVLLSFLFQSSSLSG
jgi:hypothetical protein